MGKSLFGMIAVGAALIMLSGCATTTGGQSAADLQLRVADLERQVEAKDAEIKDLKLTMKDMAYDLDRNRSTRAPSGRVVDYPKNAEVLRVNVNPETVQQALKKLGYYKGEIDGRLGSGSQAAISRFQSDRGLKADGIVGERTWRELKAVAGF